ncbi:MAG: CHAT domain-containing protein [Myxococcota bacterium]
MKFFGAGIISVVGLWGAAMVIMNIAPENDKNIRFSGCARVTEGPVCFIDNESDLGFWLEGGPFEDLRVKVDGRAAVVNTATVADGLRVSLQATRPGSVLLLATDEGGRRAFRLDVRRNEPLQEPSFDLTKPDGTDAMKRYAAALSGRAAAHAHLTLAGAARQNNDLTAAVDYHDRAAKTARDAGEWSMQARARFARTFILAFDLFKLDEARNELKKVESLKGRLPEVEAYVPYYRALIHLTAGDITSTLTDLRRAERFARALGLERLVRLVDEQRAGVEVVLGDYATALERYQRIQKWAAKSEGHACVEAYFATNLGWMLIVQQARGEKVAEPPTRSLKRALELYSDSCSDESERQIVMLNLAFAALQSSEFEDAERWLAKVDEASLTVRLRPWLEEAKVRIALARGRLEEAQQANQAMLLSATRLAADDMLYRNYVLSGDVWTRLGQYDKALRARDKAEQTLDRLAKTVPLVGARHRFLAVRDDNVLGLAGLLVAQGQPGPALTAIRKARGRSLGWARVSQEIGRLTPEQRTRWNALFGEYRRLRAQVDEELEKSWEVPSDQLKAARERRQANETRLSELLAEALGLVSAEPSIPSPPAPGVLRLGWVRLASGPVVLGQLGTDAFAVPWKEDNDEVPPEVARRLAKAKRVLLHPYGSFRNRDLHMLKWRGRPMAAQVSTAYSLDLSSAGSLEGPERALVVVDPDSELKHGIDEGWVVAAALKRAGATVTKVGGDIADVRKRLGQTDWFHFGGHGRWSPQDPMAGGLALADGARLGIGDILAAPGVPSTVVLTSCEAGRGAGRGGESFGLAHAFLAAGTKMVVAPNREVRDEAAFRFSKSFYAAEGSAIDRYTAAVKSLGEDASAFRVFVP